MKKIRALFELLRPELLFAAGICVIIGEIISLGKLPPISEISLGFLWGVFLSAPAMVLNDLFDIEVDRINAPKRALPSGLISVTLCVRIVVVRHKICV